MTKFLLAPLFVLVAMMNIAKADVISHHSLLIADPTMRAVMPGGKVTAAYMTITNTGSQDDRLVSVSYEGAKKSEIHTMEVVNDVMKMRPIDGGLVIPVGQSVELAPGGLHLMFMGLTQRPQNGETVSLELVFENAGPITITIPVTMMTGHKKSHDHNHDDHNHGDHNHGDHNHGDHNHDDHNHGSS